MSDSYDVYDYSIDLANFIEKECAYHYGEDGCSGGFYFGNKRVGSCYKPDDLFGMSVCELEDICSRIINTKTNDENEIRTIKRLKKLMYSQNQAQENSDIKESIEKMQNDIDKINDNMQTFTEVTNLFNDIDKNRNNLDDEIKKVNNRLDKLEQMLMKLLEKD